MEQGELQQQFFGHLKNVLPPHLSMVDELCELLDLSADSVYRRIRGEKPLSLAELTEICKHYHLSVDQMLKLGNETVLFEAPGLNGGERSFIDYMKSAVAQVKYFSSFKKKEVQYQCKDVPLWYFFLFREMAAFKSFFWSQTINNNPDLHNQPFSIKDHPFDECFSLGQQMLQEYNKMATIEIWNLESIHSTINQINYYKDAGLFQSMDDFKAVIDSFTKMLNHLQMQAEKGVKFMPGATDLAYKAPLQLYVNELILGSNTMFWKLDDKCFSLITFNVLSYLITSDPRFTDKSGASFQALLSRSTLISGTGEKDRNRFFNTLRDKVNALKK